MNNKIKWIEISVGYEDRDGDSQMVRKEAKTFESAEENLGKLQRFIEKNNE
jgi:hypothetical protein